MISVRPHWLPGRAVAASIAVLAAAMPTITAATLARAQAASQLSDRGPRFVTGTIRKFVPLDVSRVAFLTRRVRLDLQNVTIPDALAALAKEAPVQFAFSTDQIPVTRVSLRATEITVAAALTEILLDTDLDVHVTSTGLLSLFPRHDRQPVPSWQESGRVTGRVVNDATGEPIVLASVGVAPSGARTATDAQGFYELRGLAPGAYLVDVRALGYAPKSERTTVHGDSATEVDFRLSPAPAQLAEVVTTVTGDQRRLELGTTVSTIAADSLVKVTPITNLTDLIAGRAPGVDVLESSGLAGSGPRIRIRGANSATESNDPIVFIDGVRVDGTPGQANAFGLPVQFGLPTNGFSVPSRLNDLNPEEIESIEIVKGPSAATLYGTDAANGVIVIKTKSGQPGAPRWDVSASQGLSDVSAHFPNNYYAWGHTTDGSDTPVQCVLFNTNPFSAGPTLGSGTCAIDSITHYNPLNHHGTSIFGLGNRSLYDAQLSGGTSQLRYYVSGSATNETGPLDLPPFEIARLDEVRGVSSIPSSQVRPNALQQLQARTRLLFTPAPTADIDLNAGFVRSGRRAPNELDQGTGFLSSALYGVGYRDSVYGYNTAQSFFGAHTHLPGNVFSETGTDSVSRLTASMAANWRPLSWLAAHATAGVDFTSSDESILQLPGDDQDAIIGIGLASDTRGSANVYTSDLGATASLQVSPRLLSRTSIGAQYTRSTGVTTGVASHDLGPGGFTVDGAPLSTALQDIVASATLGGYLEQTFSYRDQLFLTGAVRVDAGSAFGSNYAPTVYPKASVSWLVLPQSQVLRLRAAYGASGVQPHGDARLLLYQPTTGETNGIQQPIVTLQQFGNPKVGPELTDEFETGFDLNFGDGRYTAEATYFNKHSHDALIDVTLPSSLGETPLQENVGAVRNRGGELALSGRLIETRLVSWDMHIAGSITNNTLLSAGSAKGSDLGFGALLAPGFPLFGNWTQRLHYADLNHDGIIEPNEVSLSDSLVYAGPRLPPYQADLSTGVTFLRGRVRVSATFSYQGGNRILNLTELDRCNSTLSEVGAEECNVPGSPLALQARQAAQALPNVIALGNSGFYEPGWFVRFRELSVTYNAPPALARAFHARTAGLTLSARNLALWTAYTGVDPESSNAYATGDLSTGVATSPPTQYWLVRLNLGF
jgi:TonB-linked SusC/RagA family outer membrane protein